MKERGRANESEQNACHGTSSGLQATEPIARFEPLPHTCLLPWAEAHVFLRPLTPALVVLAALTGCNSTPPPKPLTELSAQEQAGHAAYTARCGACHYDRQSGSLHGPSLLGVYKKPYLPSGAPSNDDRIRNTILHGRGNMPSLRGVIDDDEIRSILLYLRTL